MIGAVGRADVPAGEIIRTEDDVGLSTRARGRRGGARRGRRSSFVVVVFVFVFVVRGRGFSSKDRRAAEGS